MIEQVGFGLVAGCIVLAALLVARAKNAIHGVLWLGVVLGATAVLYVMLRAPFLAGIQLLLYVGGVMTLMILGVMLTRHDQHEAALERKRPWLAGVLSLFLLGMLVTAIQTSPELHAWIKEQRVAETAELTTPLPDDAELEITFAEKLYPLQRAFVDHAVERQRLVLADDMGLGKLQSMDSRILTPTGWTTFRDIEPGHAIIGRDGGTHCVVDKYPQGRKDLYRVTLSDGTSTLAGAEHLWAVKSPTVSVRAGAAEKKVSGTFFLKKVPDTFFPASSVANRPNA